MKFFILLWFFVSVAYANYSKMEEYYARGEYQKVIDEAKVSQSEYANPQLHLLWAKSEEALAHTKNAMSAYERVVILDESNVDAKIALLKIYKETKRRELAQELRMQLQNMQLTKEQQLALNALQANNISFLKSKFSLHLGYDSNINISADTKELENFYGNVVEGKKSTLFQNLNYGLEYINEFKDFGGFYFKSNVDVFYQDNFDAHYYDLFVLGFEDGLGYKGSNYSIYLPLAYDRIRYLNSDLMQQMALKPNLKFMLFKKYILNIETAYFTRYFIDQKFKNINDKSYSMEFSLHYLFENNFVYLRSGYERFVQDKYRDKSYISRGLTSLSCGAKYDVADLLSAQIDYRYIQSNYKGKLRKSFEKRLDSYQKLDMRLSHSLNQYTELFATYSHIQNISNYTPAQYNKHTIMFGVSRTY